MGVKLPSWIYCWFVISFIVCTIDALFVLLRPRTLPGGDLNSFVKPCELLRLSKSMTYLTVTRYNQFVLPTIIRLIDNNYSGLYL